MPLPSFAVTGDLFNIIGVDASELAANTLNGTITFTPNVSTNSFVTWEGDLYRVSPITARINGSGITYNNQPMRLLADDAGLSVTGLQWHVEISVKPDPGTGITRTMKDFWFNAPADGATVDLATVTPAPNVSVTGVAGLTEQALVVLVENVGSDIREALDAIYSGGGGGGPVAWSAITGKPAVIAAGTDQAAARTAIGAGTSDLVIGTSGTTAKAGNYQPAAVDISDATTVGRNVINAATQAAARTAIGAGTSNLALGTTSSTAKAGDYDPAWTDITGKPAVIAAGTDQAAARTAIGAGTASTKSDVGLSAVDNTADTAKPVSTAQQTALDGKQPVLTTTAVKTTTYTAAVGDLIPADATTAAFTVTLPSAPADKSRVVVKKIDTTTNVVTVACGGSDVFNKTGGVTTAALKLQNQAVQLQYKASGAIWYVISTDVPLSGTDARYSDASPVGNGPLNGVISHLKRTRSAVIQIVGDSTAVGGIGGSVSWPYRICDKIAAYYDANLWTCLWNPTNQSYDPPSARSVSTQGERQLVIPANARVNYVGVPVTGDMEIIMKITPAAWTGNVQTLLTKWTTTGNQRGFQFRLSTTGQLTLLWTTDGNTGTQVTANSTATVGFTAGAAGWVRATLDVDNGSSGYTVTFYTSTTGLTWTQLGTAVTAAGVTSVFPSTQPYEIYGGIGGAINHTWVQVRNALANGVDVVPQLPDKWGNSLTFQPTVTGGPMLLLMNGGESGKDVAWFDDPTRRPKVLATHLPDVIFTALGINDADQMWRSWADKYVTFVRHLQSWRPNVPVVVTTQNPVGLGGSYTFSFQVQGVAERHATLARALQAEAGVTVLDTAQAYTDITTQVNATDKVHPTDAGYIAQTDWMMRRLAPQTIN